MKTPSENANLYRGSLGLGCILIGFWLLYPLVVQTFGITGWFACLALMGAWYALFWVVARRTPCFPTTGFLGWVNLVGTAFGALLLPLGVFLDMPIATMVGVGAASYSFCWLSMASGVLISRQPDGGRPLRSLFVIYIVAGLLKTVLLPFATPAAPGLLATLLIAATLFVQRPMISFIDRLSATESPDVERLMRPQSFVPLTSRAFVVIFLFGLGYGQVCNGILPLSGWLQQLGALLVICATVGAVLLFKKADPVDAISSLAVCLMSAAFVLEITGGLASAASSILYESGSACFDLCVLWATLVSIASKNYMAAIPCLSWGRLASTLGLLIGGVLGQTPEGFTAVALVFVLGSFLALRGISFDRIAAEIVPVDEPLPPVDHESLESRCEHVARLFGLTNRERDVLTLLARGYSGSAIQEELVLSKNTVKSYVRSIYRKLDVHSQQEVIYRVEGQE